MDWGMELLIKTVAGAILSTAVTSIIRWWHRDPLAGPNKPCFLCQALTRGWTLNGHYVCHKCLNTRIEELLELMELDKLGSPP